MDLSSLNDNEVKALIEELKNFLKEVRIEIPPIGKYKQVAEVVGKASGISYRLHIYRGLLENKYSMHLRFAENNIHLVRLCINGNKHHNSDGSVVGVNHIHIYKLNENGQPEGYAYDLTDFPFSENDDLADAVDKFFSYINLQERGA